jgi:hypothetical protein
MMSSSTIGHLRNRLWSGSKHVAFVNSRQNGRENFASFLAEKCTLWHVYYTSIGGLYETGY